MKIIMTMTTIIVIINIIQHFDYQLVVSEIKNSQLGEFPNLFGNLTRQLVAVQIKLRQIREVSKRLRNWSRELIVS